jgi:protein ImuA
MSITALSSGYRHLDQVLPTGGWPGGVLTELLVRDLGIGELRFLTPTLRTLTQQGRRVILLAPPHIPYAPAFAAMGIAAEKITVIHASKPIDRLWAVEQILKSDQCGALLTWLDTPSQQPTPQELIRPELIRRLQLAARHTSGPVFVFRPWAAQHLSSPAPLRMLLLPRRYPDLAVQVIKRRGPIMLAPIDVALPIPGSGLRSLKDHEAIIAAPIQAPTEQAMSLLKPLESEQRHALDRLQHPLSLSGAITSAPSGKRSSLPH